MAENAWIKSTAYLLTEVYQVPSTCPQQPEAETSLLLNRLSDVFLPVVRQYTYLAWSLPPSGHWDA